MQQQLSAPEKVHRYRCPGCGADLVFEPRDGCLTCPYCGRQERIEAGAEGVEERSYVEYLRPHADRVGTLAPSALEVSCQTCGATVTFAPPMVAGECDFCGSPLVAQPRSADPILAPEGVLPFRVGTDAASESIRRWLSALWFAPNALKRLAAHEAVGGVYLPFWTFDAHTSTRYEGARGEYYYTTHRDTSSNTERRVRHTRWHPAAGTLSRWFDDLLVPATKSLPPARLKALEPWDLAELTRYEPAYLSGYKAQRYQVELPEGFAEAQKVVVDAVERDVRADIGGDEQRIDHTWINYSGVTFKHLLLPVYVGAYRFRGRVFQVVVNGRTGEVQGERPYSFWKIFFLVAAVAVIIAALVLVFGSER